VIVRLNQNVPAQRDGSNPGRLHLLACLMELLSMSNIICRSSACKQNFVVGCQEETPIVKETADYISGIVIHGLRSDIAICLID
jgi:hypothetical protein